MGKIIIMNTTLRLYSDEYIQQLVSISEIKQLNDNVYLILPEQE